jgi:hypothetical protein
MNKETIEEAANKFASQTKPENSFEEGLCVGKALGFIKGVEWQVMNGLKNLKRNNMENLKKEVTGVDDNRPKPNYCYVKEQGHGGIGCVFPVCHCGLPIKQEEPKQIEDEFEMQSRIINKVWNEDEPSKKMYTQEQVKNIAYWAFDFYKRNDLDDEELENEFERMLNERFKKK